MSADGRHTQEGQSIVLVAMAMLGLVIFVAITVDLSSAYVGRRTAQNGADGAALAAARQLAYQINHDTFSDSMIQIELNDFAERNGVADTDGTLANTVNRHVEGFYLNVNGDPIVGAAIGGGSVPNNAWGVEATTYITTPSFLGGVLGFDGYPVQASAAVVLERACGVDCLLPIAAHTMAFTTTAPCYNFWNGEGPGNFGWLNWSIQGYSCQQDDCSAICLATNLENENCNSGFLRVGDWVAGTTGVTNDVKVRRALEYYIDTPEEALVPVWDITNGGSGCGGLQYQVAGFARIQILGYKLSQGNSYPDVSVFDPSTCVTLGTAPNDGNRISARFIDWAGGEGGNCRAIGTLRAPVLTK